MAAGPPGGPARPGEDAAARHGLPTVRLASLLLPAPTETIRLDTCCHYRSEGHARIAEGLAPILTDRIRARARRDPVPPSLAEGRSPRHARALAGLAQALGSDPAGWHARRDPDGTEVLHLSLPEDRTLHGVRCAAGPGVTVRLPPADDDAEGGSGLGLGPPPTWSCRLATDRVLDDGARLPAGTSVSHHLLTHHPAVATVDGVVGGPWPLTGAVTWYADGSPRSGTLATDTSHDGLSIPAGTHLVLHAVDDGPARVLAFDPVEVGGTRLPGPARVELGVTGTRRHHATLSRAWLGMHSEPAVARDGVTASWRVFTVDPGSPADGRVVPRSRITHVDAPLLDAPRDAWASVLRRLLEDRPKEVALTVVVGDPPEPVRTETVVLPLSWPDDPWRPPGPRP